MRTWLFKSVFVLAATTAVAADAALVFNFTRDGATTQSDFDNTALPAFTAAGQRWSNLFSNDITVNITIGYRSLGAGTLGSATSSGFNYSFATARSALASAAQSPDDFSAAASLPSGSSVPLRMNDLATGVGFFDNNASSNNSGLQMHSANAKALGLVSANDAASDASITFSSDIAWDLNPSDGVDAGKYDLVGVATHEIGHALGFYSVVDLSDQFTAPRGPLRGLRASMDGFISMSLLDLFRFSADSLAMGAGVRDNAVGGSPYFSIDNGITPLGAFATGLYNGDRRQASHWKDLLGLGIMDPTFAAGEVGQITNLDVRALDVIGYTIVPEPACTTLMAPVSLMFLRRRRRR